MPIVESKFFSVAAVASGVPLDIAATASAGDELHTVPADQTDLAGIWVFNYGATSPKLVTIEYGGTDAKDRESLWVHPNLPMVKAVSGDLLTRVSGTPVIRVFCETTTVCSATGYIERYGGTADDAAQTWVKLSGSTDGKAIDISATTSVGANTIHAATTTANERDFVWLYGYNYDTDNARGISVELGAATASATLTVTIPPRGGRVLLIPGLPYNNVTIKAYAAVADDGTAAAASKVAVRGRVYRRAAP